MWQQAINGVFVGAIYALFAVGYALVFGVLDILNLAHQAVFTLSAFIALAFVADGNLPLTVALPVSLLAAGLIGIGLERAAFRPLRGRTDSNISGLISSLAAATILEAVALQIWGPDVQRFPLGTFPDKPLRVLGATVSALQLTIIAISLALMAALTAVLRATRLGRQIRAARGDSATARICRPRRVASRPAPRGSSASTWTG